jgi:hypothetical protein
MRTIAIFALAGSLAASGCFTTRIGTEDLARERYEHRQWFTVFGLVPVTEPAGEECPNGLSYAESSYDATDFLIDLGVGVIAGIVASQECSGTDPTTCAVVAGGVASAVIGARTVAYQCR